MVLLTLLDIGLSTTWWLSKKTYNVIYYIIYGDEDKQHTKLLLIEFEKLQKCVELLEQK